MASALVVPLGAETVTADSRPSPLPFRSIVDRSILVVLVTVMDIGGAETTLAVDRVLKGRAGPTLVFPTRVTNVSLAPAEQVVMAFETLDLDPRSGTIAWVVGADGQLDPMHFQQAPGLPATLPALLAAFGDQSSSPNSATAPSPADDSSTANNDSGSSLWVLLLGVIVILTILWTLARWRRDRTTI